MADDKAKKLAKEVQLARTSEDYDLAGYGPEQMHTFVQAAFSSPLPIAEVCVPALRALMHCNPLSALGGVYLSLGARDALQRSSHVLADDPILLHRGWR